MNDFDVKQLHKVNESRRGFLKKAAIGTAYALPVMTTFSLDSVRKKAKAQGVYGNPRVLSLEVAPPSAFGGDASAQDLPTLLGWFVITYDRPMDKKFNTAKVCDFEKIDTGCAVFDCYADELTGCSECDKPSWQWNKDGTKEYGELRDIYGASGYNLKLLLNGDGCKEGDLYRDLEGNILDPWHGCALFCKPVDP